MICNLKNHFDLWVENSSKGTRAERESHEIEDEAEEYVAGNGVVP